MILLSPHTDTVFNNPQIGFKNGQHVGLLDNFIGVLTTYLSLYQHESMAQLERDGHIGIYHNRGEEYGYLTDAPKLDPEKDMVIVVDICADKEGYADFDVSIENIHNYPDLDEIIAELRREGFRIRVKPYTGETHDHDESFSWIALGIPVVTFTIPIHAVENNWHRVQCDNTVSYEVVARASTCLTRFILHSL
jgi:hypothetical protein